jgi:hypothetical protein
MRIAVDDPRSHPAPPYRARYQTPDAFLGHLRSF